MKIKRYLDKDMRHVLKRVREDQGPDAVILSNRRVDDGIEVIAAVDYDEALVRHAIAAEAQSAGGEDRPLDSAALARIAEDDFNPKSVPAAEILSAELVTRDAAATARVGGAADGQGTIAKMHEEIASLRGLLETQLSGLVWKDTTERDPLRAQMLRNLARLGVAPDIAAMVLDRLEPVADVRRLWQAPLMALAQLVPVRDDRLLEEGGTFALIGPTGVGKTTTIAKIAARFAMQHSADDIALISADSYRIGAKEHLMAFANIIGTRVYAASSSDELTELLTRLEGKRLILIDTEGRSPRDRELANRLAAYGNHRDRVRFYLALSAATQEAAIDEAIECFRKVPLEGAIVTKIDESAQLGATISALIRHDLPACWFTDGQRVPDDLHRAARKKMWFINQAVEALEQAMPQIDERLMAERYASLGAAHA